MISSVAQDILRICPELGRRVELRDVIVECGLFLRDCAGEILTFVPDLRQRREQFSGMDGNEIIAFWYSSDWLVYRVGQPNIHHRFDNNCKFVNTQLGLDLSGAYQIDRDVIAINIDHKYALTLSINSGGFEYSNIVIPDYTNCGVVLPCGIAIYRVGDEFMMRYDCNVLVIKICISDDEFIRLNDYGVVD